MAVGRQRPEPVTGRPCYRIRVAGVIVRVRAALRPTGRDLAAGALGRAELLRAMGAAATTPEPAQSRTGSAPRRPGARAAAELTAAQLRMVQRISHAGVGRSNALIARLEAGLTGGAFADGTITARNPGAELTAP